VCLARLNVHLSCKVTTYYYFSQYRQLPSSDLAGTEYLKKAYFLYKKEDTLINVGNVLPFYTYQSQHN